MPELATRSSESCSFTPLFRESKPNPVRRAREFVRLALSVRGMPEGRVDDGCVVTSELVTNALVHVPDANVFLLCVSRNDEGFLIEVWDPSTDLPVVNENPGGQSGRGLVFVVTALSLGWGFRVLPPKRGGGKIVWALL